MNIILVYTIEFLALCRIQLYVALVASVPAATNFYLQARRLQVLYIVALGRASVIQRYYNCIHSTKYAEVINVNCAANSTLPYCVAVQLSELRPENAVDETGGKRKGAQQLMKSKANKYVMSYYSIHDGCQWQQFWFGGVGNVGNS